LFFGHVGTLKNILRSAKFFLAESCATQYLFLRNARTSMNTEQEDRPQSRTRILFDLADVLAPEEVEQFQRAAEEAGAKSLTEHFLNLTLRLNPKQAA
jgi:hypothetical protein